MGCGAAVGGSGTGVGGGCVGRGVGAGGNAVGVGAGVLVGVGNKPSELPTDVTKLGFHV